MKVSMNPSEYFLGIICYLFTCMQNFDKWRKAEF